MLAIALTVVFLLHLVLGANRIEYVVVLMQENRSFDHIMGFLKQNDSRIEGCLPNQTGCSNPYDPQNKSSPIYYVNDQAAERQISDPNHSQPDTTLQVYGYGPDTQVPPPMSGFIQNYANKEIIMECFPPELVPASTTLAQEFAVWNRWYASVPGPTEPNRLYFMTATSDGSATNDDIKLAEGYPQRSVFENIDESIYNRTWGVYFGDAPSAFFVKYTRRFPEKFHAFPQFHEDALSGTLPSFSFLEPRYFDLPDIPADDQHPDHDVGEGDHLMKEIYESLIRSPLWNKTLFLITYDEHGGFFDHVPPPTDCPNPDGKNATDVNPPFDFMRLGVRVPAIAISPWIKRGTVLNEPNSTHYEHPSMISTVRNLLVPDQPFLTKRDAWAQPFDWLVNVLDEPRTDYPKVLPEAPTQREAYNILPSRDRMGQGPATPLQKTLIKVATALETGRSLHDGEGVTEMEGAYIVAEHVNAFLRRDVVQLGI